MLVLALCATSASAQQAPLTAFDVIAKYREAIGGTERLASITSLLQRGEISGSLAGYPGRFEAPVLQANHGTYEFYYKAPNRRVTVIRMGSSGFMNVRGCDGKVSWYSNPYQGQGVLKPKSGELYDCESGFDLLPSIYREPNVQLQFKGTKKLGTHLAYVIRVESSKTHKSETDYFDADNYFLIRSEFGLWTGSARSYDDYRDVGGIKFPFVTTQETENSKTVTTLRQVQINAPILDSAFEQPNQKKQSPTTAEAQNLPSPAVSDDVNSRLSTPPAQLPTPTMEQPQENENQLAATETRSLAQPLQPVIYVNTVNFASCSMPELLQAVPELHDVNGDQTSDFSGLLDKIGEKVFQLLRKTPDLISHEEVLETQPNHSTTRRHFSYLVLSHPSKEALMIEEFRMDPHGASLENSELSNSRSAQSLNDLRERSLNASRRGERALPLAQGFANMWLNFLPNNRSMSAFRYIGQQKIDQRNTLVVAFAQKPAMGVIPGQVEYQGKSTSVFFQGIAWVDESDFRIVRLRSDLLSPPVEVPLYQLTAEIQFMDTPVGGLAAPLWLPRQVDVTSDFSGFLSKDKHTYSEYRLFGVTSRIKLDP